MDNSKFLSQSDYDNLIERIKDERENPEDLIKHLYSQYQNTNTNFLNSLINAANRAQKPIFTKWIEVCKLNSHMNIDIQVKNDPDFRDYEGIKTIIQNLENVQQQSEIDLSEQENIPNQSIGVIEKLLILHYLKIDSLKRTVLNSKQGTYFLSTFLELNPESIKKAHGKIENYTKNKVTIKTAEQYLPTLYKIYDFFKDSDLREIANDVELRINELRTISGKD